MINPKTIHPFSSHHRILRVHRNSMLASPSPNTCRHTSRTQTQELQMASIRVSHHDTVHKLKAIMISRTKAVSSFSKYLAVHRHRRQAINSQQAHRVNGTFHHIIPTSIPQLIITIIIIHLHCRIRIMDIHRVGVHWIRHCWIIIACCRIITTIMVWIAHSVEHFCPPDSQQMVNRASLALDRFNYGSSCSNFLLTNRVRALSRGLVMDGNLNSRILMKWD